MKKYKLLLFGTFIFLTLLLVLPSNQATFNSFTIYYDDDSVETYLTPDPKDIVAVRFSPPTDTFKLSGMNIYFNISNKQIVRVWVWDASRNILMEPMNITKSFSSPPYHFDFGEYGPIFTPENVSDFYIVLQWLYNDAPDIGVDTTMNSGRSYSNHSGSLQLYSTGNIMIRAVLEDIKSPAFDHIPMQHAIAGESLSISMEVADEFGVQSVILYYRTNGSSDLYGAVSLTLTGDSKKGIWYGTIPGINVTAQGLEYYLWATDIGGNSRYYGNSTNPYVVSVFGQIFEVPIIVSIIAIIAFSAAAVVLVFLLPKYQGAETE